MSKPQNSLAAPGGGAVVAARTVGVAGKAMGWAVVSLSFATLSTGCVVENEPRSWAKVDRQVFECAVQPIFSRECSMPACHGSPARRLKVLSPGRMRLPAELSKALAAQSADDREAGNHPALTSIELDYNFVQARSMIAPDQPLADCPLLNRPLAVAAGGMYHVQGGDIFTNTADADYLTLQAWIQGLGKEQLCK